MRDGDAKPLEYASNGASREQLRRRTKFRASLLVQLLAGGIITCVLYFLLLGLVFWIWQTR